MTSANDQWVASGAKWICLHGSRDDANLYLQFARVFQSPASATLRLDITAVSQYQAALNGVTLGRGPAVSSPDLYYFHSYTVDPALVRPGDNRISVDLFHDGLRTETVQGFQYGKPGLLLHLRGSGVDLVSDTTWRVRRAPMYSRLASKVSNWGSYKEYYHGEAEDDWTQLGFDDSTWDVAVVAAEPVSKDFVRRLELLDVPELAQTVVKPRRVVDLACNLGRIEVAGSPETPFPYDDQPIEIATGEYGGAPSVTFDFGTMWVGYPEIETIGAGCIYEVWYGETLDMARLDVVRMPKPGAWKAFQRRAFRFMRIAFIALEGPVTLMAVRQRNTWYAYNADGELTTSDERVNRMLHVTRHTLRVNTSYHYEDCPIREQALWIMDMRIMALLNVYLYGNHELNAKCLRQSFAIQRENGHIASTGPKDNAMFHLDFLFHLVAALRDHYQHTGDADLVRGFRSNLDRLLSFLLQWEDEDGLLDTQRHPGGVLFLDWSDRIVKQGKTTILNSLYALYLDDMAFLTEVGGGSDAESYRRRARAVRARIHEVLYSPRDGVYHDAIQEDVLLPAVSQQANLAAILADVAPGAIVPDIMAEVWDGDGFARPYGPSFYLIMVDALAKIRRFDAMNEVLHSYWGAMLDRSAITWWEVFNPETPFWSYPHPFLGNTPTYELDWIPVSACHGWSGIPGYAIPRYLLGVDLSGLYQDRVTICPGLPGLYEKATYSVPIRGELLRMEFRGDGSRYEIGIQSAPRGVQVDVVQ